MQRFLRALIALSLPAGLALAIVPSVTAEDRWVTMFDSDYLPGVVTIRAGERVTWVNDDDLPHDAVGNGWSTPLLTKGDSSSVRFIRAGTYRYSCSIHPAMRSSVRVVGAGATIPPTDTVASATDGPASGAPGWALLTWVVGSGIVVTWITRRRLRRSG
jgi:plastocyanin